MFNTEPVIGNNGKQTAHWPRIQVSLPGYTRLNYACIDLLTKLPTSKAAFTLQSKDAYFPKNNHVTLHYYYYQTPSPRTAGNASI